MKTIQKTTFYILLLLTAVTTSCGNGSKTTGETTADVQSEQKSEQPDIKEKKLPFERGSYVEVSNAMGMDVEKTVYFDKWGDWTASETKSEMEIMKGYIHKTHKIEIVKGNTHWNLDLIEKTGTTYEGFVPTAGMAALGAAIGGQMAEGMEMKDLGEEDYLGYKCKKIQVIYTDMKMDATILSYGNLTMKMIGKMGKMDVSSKVTSIDLSAPPASIFEVPEGVTVTAE